MGKRKMSTQNITAIGIMCGIAAVLSYYPEIPMVFFAPFLKLDFAFVPVLLTGFSLGMWPGFLVLLIKNIIRALGTDSMLVGQLADVLAGTAMLAPAACIYRRRHTRAGALWGMAAGTVAMAMAGVLANRFILLPAYMGEGLSGFMEANPNILWAAIAPFNLVKGAAVSLVVFLLYRHLAPFIKHGLKGK